jgi:ankyrin repeat protein
VCIISKAIVSLLDKSLTYVLDVNVQDKNDLSPLHVASFYGWVEMARVLIDHGATAHSEDNLGRTPLHLVAKGTGCDIGHDGVGVAVLLLEHGADGNAPDKHQTTPLHLASYCGNVGIVRVLLDRGANASVKNDHDLTPLHMVSLGAHFSQNDGVDVALLLLEHGVDVDAQDNDHATPSDLALRQGRGEIASFLLQYGDNTTRRIDQHPTPGIEDWHITDYSLGAAVSRSSVSKSRLPPWLGLCLPQHRVIF